MDAMIEEGQAMVSSTKKSVTHLGCVVNRVRVFHPLLSRMEEHITLEGPAKIELDERVRGHERVGYDTARLWRRP